ncbi:LysR substrate-binding domain-containing protein [Streptomyces sp. NBC_00555]|uniref:LysR substrate-binding domain-containing protein n=1 Tax=Streptomyces sp. NBC_00555 TaxID=2903662 RepID=UPI0022571822|nr:LysR substrate-binding domain-containing protein [Streptomyces sp. NBC_00555]MCX5014941.1 LysR substrate-binding domain-containing protein [Streptomyces sp. NBC_00555]
MELRTLRYFVAVAEELHFGRAAARLHMSQPPLSRAIKQLEVELGAALFLRSAAGVMLTPAGAALLEEARNLLDQADRVRVRVTAAAGAATLTVGILGDTTDRGATRLAAAYRRRHPGVEVRIRETDLTDPTCGLRARLVDVALTRAPFDETGLAVHELRADPVGVVLRADDPLARHDRLTPADLADRRWFRFPDGTDPIWQSYWSGGEPREGQVVRAVQECLQAVLWNGTVGMTPLGHELPEELAVVPLIGIAPSRVVAAWNKGDPNPLIQSFVQIATAAYRGPASLEQPPFTRPVRSW